jgi:hypothetical protein
VPWVKRPGQSANHSAPQLPLWSFMARSRASFTFLLNSYYNANLPKSMTSHPFVARHFSSLLHNYAAPQSLNSSVQLLHTATRVCRPSCTYTDVQVLRRRFVVFFTANPLPPNDIYIYIYIHIYIYIYISYRTSILHKLHFKYLFNKYPY